MLVIIGILAIVKLVLIGCILFLQFRGMYRTVKSIRDLKKNKFNIIELANTELKNKVVYRYIFKLGVYLILTMGLAVLLKVFTNGSSVSVFSVTLWSLMTLSYYWDYKCKKVLKIEGFKSTMKTILKGYVKQFKIELIHDFKYVKSKLLWWKKEEKLVTD
jgi:hypothetical protein